MSETATPDFSAEAKTAEAHRLAGEYEEAGKIYRDLADRDDPLTSGYGHHHLSITMRNLAEKAKGGAAVHPPERYLDEALKEANTAREQYEKAGDTIRASAAILDRAMVFRDKLDFEQAETLIDESIKYLEDQRHTVTDTGFFNEHLGIKRVRLAEVYFKRGDLDGTKRELAKADAIPQSNPYFVMVRDQIAGDVFSASGDIDEAKKAYEKALEYAARVNEPRRVKQLEQALTELG